MFKHKNNCYIWPSAKCNSYLNNILHKMCISFTEAKKNFYLELTILSSFLNGNSYSYSSTNHRVITQLWNQIFTIYLCLFLCCFYQYLCGFKSFTHLYQIILIYSKSTLFKPYCVQNVYTITMYTFCLSLFLFI